MRDGHESEIRPVQVFASVGRNRPTQFPRLAVQGRVGRREFHVGVPDTPSRLVPRLSPATVHSSGHVPVLDAESNVQSDIFGSKYEPAPSFGGRLESHA
ncbi:hypothetical protein [Halorussus caseinilyticus]|uniref:Uncharacterized protein n=1 Tax=Halorussus caseinilyticus TaxID=3034025 RepID=A0ABD5WI30_9EURY